MPNASKINICVICQDLSGHTWIRIYSKDLRSTVEYVHSCLLYKNWNCELKRIGFSEKNKVKVNNMKENMTEK